MSDALVFNCPKCGASLDVPPKQSNAKCPYCGSTLVLPEQPETVQDLQAEQMAMVNNVIQSATEMQSQRLQMTSGIAKSTLGVLVGGTIVVPLIITAVTFILILCVFGIVWYSFGSMFSILR